MADTGERGPKRRFWQNVKSEFGKITWPDRETMLKQTAVVVVISVALGLIIALLDFVLKFGVDYIVAIGA